MVKAERKIKNIRASWEQLIKSSEESSTYLRCDFHSLVNRSYVIHKLLSKNYTGRKLLYFCVSKDGTGADLIFPAIVDSKSMEILFSGECAECGYNDFIYSADTPDSCFYELFSYLKNTYPGYSLRLDKIRPGSRLCRLCNVREFNRCFGIYLNSFDEWFAERNRRFKKNLHLYSNRIKSDGYETDICYLKNVCLADRIRMFSLYSRHLKELYIKEGKPLTKEMTCRVYALLRSVPAFFANAYFSSIGRIDNCFVQVLRIDGRIAAFLLGYEEGSGILLSKCAYDCAYASYSPGFLNLNRLIQNRAENGVRSFDMLGGFFDYKVRFGGKEYSNYSLHADLQIPDSIYSTTGLNKTETS